VTRERFDLLKATMNELGMSGRPGFRWPPAEGELLNVLGNRFVVGEVPDVRNEPHPGDLEEITAVVRNASEQADYVIVTIHAHEGYMERWQPAEFLETFAYDGMMSWAYGRKRANAIDMAKASLFEPGDPWKFEGSGYKLYRETEGFHRAGQTAASPSDTFRGSGEEDTTFLCAADRHGNLLLLTSSLLRGFGSKVTVPGLGITLNSSMYSLSPKPGHPQSIAPFKRTLRNSGPR